MVRRNHHRKLPPEHVRGRGGHLRGRIHSGTQLPILFELEIRKFMIQNSTPEDNTVRRHFTPRWDRPRR